mmetsp:Transcript_1839/g.5093  ORF Transcript_1839/g.5093 Transcript_1839/m.5093 type:complete len:230 (-) Transcript_1839:26-715(-)
MESRVKARDERRADDDGALSQLQEDAAACIVADGFLNCRDTETQGPQVVLHAARKLRDLLPQDLLVVHDARDVHGPGLPLEPHAAHHEVVATHDVALLRGEKLEERPRVVHLDAQRVEVGEHHLVVHVLLQLLHRHASRLVAVEVPEEPLRFLDELLLVLQRFLDLDLRVMHGALHCTLAEDTCHDVEDGKEHKADVHDEQDQPEKPYGFQRLGRDFPTNAIRDALKKR